MELIRFFGNISKNDAAIAGGKGASLGEMTQAGIPVPPGFVVLSASFERFLEETDLNVEIDAILDSVNHKEIHTVEYASEKIQALILSVAMPDDIAATIEEHFDVLGASYVAVRSSATAEDSASAAWAGQLDSYLNTTERTLLENVRRCWASLFTPRAIFYRFEKGLHTQKISVAVVIQKMVASEVSGIAFSVHPVTEDRNQLIIEAGFGLGEAIVSGTITPDSYVVEKDPRHIIDTNVNTQTRALYRASDGGNEWRDLPEAQASSQVLIESQILELSEIILTIENHYGFPCDIEWAYEAGVFYIVQSRPITTLIKIEEGQKSNLLNKKWTKIWTTEYSMLSVWLFGREYIENCKKELGFGFDDVIFLIEGDLATIYRDNEKQKGFVKFLAEKSLIVSGFSENCLKEYYRANDDLREYIKISEKEAVNYGNLLKFIALHNKFITNLLVFLWSPDGFDSLDASEELKNKIFKKYEQARRSTEHTYLEIEKFFQKVFSYIASIENVEAKFLRVMLPEELLEYSKSGTLPSLETLKARYDYCVLLCTEKENRLVLGEEARSIIEKISPIDTEGTEEIHGSVANKGKVIGTVRKIFLEKDMRSFKPGEILVTTMTRPEWLLIMKTAGGFITDAGGVLSHAAIVSRELDKPCIIGTTIATQVLKDGDLVEVDADNGVVRILEKKKNDKTTLITTLMHNDIASSDTKIDIPDFIHHVAFLASRPQSVQRDEVVYLFLKRSEHLGVGIVSIPLEGLNRALYTERQSIEKIYQQVIDGLSTEEKLADHLKAYENLMHEYQEATIFFRNCDARKKNLRDAFDRFIELTIKLSDYVWIPFTIDTSFGTLFRERLKEESGDQYESIQEGIASPTRFHEYQNMRLAMCEHIINGDDMHQAAADLTEKYDWYGEYSYVEKLYDEGYFQMELAKHTPESAADEKKKLNDDLRENIGHFKNALSKISDPTTALYAKIINQYLFLRTDRVDSFKKLQAAFRNIFEKIAENLGKETGEIWSMEEVVSMTNEEILNYLDGVATPDKTEMTRRTHRYVYFRNPQMTRVLTEESEMNGITDIVLSSVGQDEGIKGLVAYKGVATGRVVTVFSKNDLHKVIDGSVLVARTTMVDYISAMERAVAFVTEEGGVTSHAAIVARELKKPCVVGTGNCTRMLKDGDLVEVDADNGVVRIVQDGQDAVKNPEADLSYAGHTWFMTITRNMSFWHQCLSSEGHFRYTKDFGMDAELQVLHITKGGTETSLFMHNPNYNEYSEAVLEKVSTKDGIVDLKEKYHSYAQQLLSALDKAKNNLTAESLEDFLDAYRRFSAGLMITATLGRSGADKLTETLKMLGYTEEEIPQMNSLITYPQQHTPLFQSRLDLLKIGIGVQEKSLREDALQKSLSRWLSEYGHIPVNFCESPWSLDDARKQLDNLLREDCTEEYTKAEENHKELTEKGKGLLEKIGDEKVSILARAVAEGTYLNEFRKHIFSRASLEYRGVFEEIAKQAGSGNWRDCFYFTPIEMLDILSGANMDISFIVEKREIAGMYIDAEGVSHLLDRDTIDRFRSYISNIHGSSRENTNGDIIKGSSANRGKVTGTARLILSSKDFDKLNPGEILVTTMTSVDFVPVMGRAAAFVTNEGGITSHASIVAREMNKPCIIGTKIATQVLKDGDLVEVDADNGVVRILERKLSKM